MSDEHKLVATFRIHTTENPSKSKEAGRPIFDDMELCEIRMAANKLTVGAFPAHEVWKVEIDEVSGYPRPITYAMRFPEKYKQFKANLTQTQSGTPLEELTFLTQGRRLELKAMNIHTVEALSTVDMLEMKGVSGIAEMKKKALEYLAAATDGAKLTKLADENAQLKAQFEAMKAEFEARKAPAKPEIDESAFEGYEDIDLKAIAKDLTGETPKGNPSRATLIRIITEAKSAAA